MAPGLISADAIPETTQQPLPSKGILYPVNSAGDTDTDTDSEDHARSLDAADPLRDFRAKFIIPTRASLQARSFPLSSPVQTAAADSSNGETKPTDTDTDTDTDRAVYLCGNSLGVQPRCTAQYVQAQLDTWAALGVGGHFAHVTHSPLSPWQAMADVAAEQSCRLVGAVPGEVAVANTLTVNLHLLMASFYRPTQRRNKILLEWKAFPSDHVSNTLDFFPPDFFLARCIAL
jgi:kynureninase